MRKIVLKIDRKHSALQDAALVLDQGKQQMVFILLFTVLYLFRDLGGTAIPDIVFTTLCALSFIVADMGTCLGMYMFTTALTVPHSEIRIVYFVIIIAKMFASGRIQLNGKLLMITLGFLLLQLLNVTIFSQSIVENVVYDYVTRMLVLIMPILWYNNEYSAEDFNSALMCYVAGVLVGGTVTMILTAERRSWEYLLTGAGGKRLGKTYNTSEGMQTNYNANQLGIMFAITVSVVLGRLDRKRMSKILSIGIIGYSMFMVLLTRSRTGLLMVAFAVLAYILVVIVRRKRLLTGIFIGVIIAALVMGIAYFFPELTQRFANRFTDQEDITNGRLDIGAYYLYKWMETPWCFLFGYGIGSFFDELGVGVSPHNAITDILISWGLVGLVLVATVIIMCWKRGIQAVDKKDRVMALLPAVVALISSMAGQYLIAGYPHMRLCFLMLAAKTFATEKNADKETLGLESGPMVKNKTI